MSRPYIRPRRTCTAIASRTNVTRCIIALLINFIADFVYRRPPNMHSSKVLPDTFDAPLKPRSCRIGLPTPVHPNPSLPSHSISHFNTRCHTELPTMFVAGFTLAMLASQRSSIDIGQGEHMAEDSSKG
ncbi:hypothetical protein B0J14DRAFT_650705 [Halenospora varia]|nr:hypothetical protein B0J14DRAFT_650705 [Halenospora varia]